MIDYIEKLLELWGEYYADGDRIDNGLPGITPIYRMMRELAPTHLGNYRQQRHYIPLESSGAVTLVLRYTTPMRSKETRSISADREPENLLADIVERGITHTNHGIFRDIAKARYTKPWNNQICAENLGMSLSTFKRRLTSLHEGLDDYIKTQHPELFDQMSAIFS